MVTSRMRGTAASLEHLVRTVSAPVSNHWRPGGNPVGEPLRARRASHRFDDPVPEASKRFGVSYAARNLETAFSESVIHECFLQVGGRYAVRRSELDRRTVVRFDHPRRGRLMLADTTGESLKAMGLNNDLSAGDDYLLPLQRSRAIFQAKLARVVAAMAGALQGLDDSAVEDARARTNLTALGLGVEHERDIVQHGRQQPAREASKPPVDRLPGPEPVGTSPCVRSCGERPAPAPSSCGRLG